LLLAVGFLLLVRRALRRRRENAVLHAAEPAVAARLASLFGAPASAEAAEAEPLPPAPVPVMAQPEPLAVMAEPAPIAVMAEATSAPAVADPAVAALSSQAQEDAGPGSMDGPSALAVVPFPAPAPAAPDGVEPLDPPAAETGPALDLAGASAQEGDGPSAPLTPEPPPAPASAEPPAVVPPPITVFVPPTPVEPVAALPAAVASAPTTYGSGALAANGIWDGGGTVDPGYAAAAAAAAETIRRQRRRQTAAVWMPSVRPGRLLRMPEDPRQRMGRDASAVLLVVAVVGLVLLGANVLQLPGGGGASGSPGLRGAVAGGSATPDSSQGGGADPTQVAFSTTTPAPTATPTAPPPARTPPVTNDKTSAPATPRLATPRPAVTPTSTPLVAAFVCSQATAGSPLICANPTNPSGASYQWFVGQDPAALQMVSTDATLVHTFDQAGFYYIQLVLTRGNQAATKDGAFAVQ
jgi:hypothetical protein